VINYDVPDTADAYIHRIGRTGRAERDGDAFTLFTPEDQATVRDIERALRRPLERRTLPRFDYNASAPASAEAEFHRPPQVRQPSRQRPVARPTLPANGRGLANRKQPTR